MTIDIRVDEQKCVGCQDCLFICPVRVFEMRKGKAVVVDAESCCGTTCRLCIHYCWKDAITHVDRQTRETGG